MTTTATIRIAPPAGPLTFGGMVPVIASHALLWGRRHQANYRFEWVRQGAVQLARPVQCRNTHGGPLLGTSEWRNFTARPDPTGLRVGLTPLDTDAGRRVFAHVRDRRLCGWSWQGFATPPRAKATDGEITRLRIEAVDLVEIGAWSGTELTLFWQPLDQWLAETLFRR